jgi:hypothetical protein
LSRELNFLSVLLIIDSIKAGFMRFGDYLIEFLILHLPLRAAVLTVTMHRDIVCLTL